MAIALRFPAAIASISVAAPGSQSPPAKTPDCPVAPVT